MDNIKVASQMLKLARALIADDLFEKQHPYEGIEDVKRELRTKLEKDFPYVGIGNLLGSIGIDVSLDDKSDWPHGILQNSRYLKIVLDNDGTMEAASQHRKLKKFRKTKAKSVDDVVAKLKKWSKEQPENVARIAKVLLGGVPSFSKFVTEYEVDDYPYGRERTKAIYKVESKGSNARVCRVTLDPKTGRWNKPKCTTFGPAATIGIASNGYAYPIVGRPGQIAVWQGDMKHTEGSVFSDDSNYNDLADALGFRRVPGRITVKETSNGAEVDGLQGQRTTPREIMNHAGLPNELIDAEVLSVKAKKSKDMMSTDWIVTFKPEANKKPFVIKVYG